VRSCVCENHVDTEHGSQDDQDEPDARDGCRAPSPIVRTRWFFNPTCEACLDREAACGRDARKVLMGDDVDEDRAQQ